MEMLEIALRNPGLLRQDARRGHERRCRPACRSSRCAGRTTTSRPRRPSWSPRTMSCSSSAPTKEALAQASRALGEAAPGRLVKDRSDLDYLRVFASRPTRGGPGARRPRPAGRQGVDHRAMSAAATPTSCRGPTSCSSSATASACSPIAAILPALRKFFGDSIKGTAEFSYISIGLGMALGFLIGAIQIADPRHRQAGDRACRAC